MEVGRRQAARLCGEGAEASAVGDGVDVVPAVVGEPPHQAEDVGGWGGGAGWAAFDAYGAAGCWGECLVGAGFSALGAIEEAGGPAGFAHGFDIPMKGAMESLNASVAGSILLESFLRIE